MEGREITKKSWTISNFVPQPRGPRDSLRQNPGENTGKESCPFTRAYVTLVQRLSKGLAHIFKEFSKVKLKNTFHCVSEKQ